MNKEAVLSGNAGVEGVQYLLNGQTSRRLLKQEAQKMLRKGYRMGPFHLTRAKFKPGRKLSAYFNFPALDEEGSANPLVHLAVTWQPSLESTDRLDTWSQLQEEANQSGLMPVQCELWRELPEQGIRLQLWPFDPKFPHLVRLGNPSHVGEMLKSLGVAQSYRSLPMTTPIRYRPGERHVLRYEIESPEGIPSPARRLYAKLYKSGEDAARAFGVANRVVDWLDSNPVGIQGVRPVAMSGEDGMILYPHAPGIPLSHQLHRSRRWVAAQLHSIGKGLATLHGGPDTLQVDLKQNDFTKEAKVVRRASEHIQVLLPATYDKILEIVGRAEALYASLPQEAPTFTHADFKSDHLLTTSQGLTLIDFDTCTLTDPALDLGKFLADLEWWFTLRGITGVEGAQEELLKGYMGEGESDPVVHERLARARLFYALILVKIVVRRVPIFKKDWAARTARLIERAGDVIHNPSRSYQA